MEETIFSGEESKELWRLIRKGKKRHALYFLGCKCQELEALVREQRKEIDALKAAVNAGTPRIG